MNGELHNAGWLIYVARWIRSAGIRLNARVWTAFPYPQIPGVYSMAPLIVTVTRRDAGPRIHRRTN